MSQLSPTFVLIDDRIDQCHIFETLALIFAYFLEIRALVLAKQIQIEHHIIPFLHFFSSHTISQQLDTCRCLSSSAVECSPVVQWPPFRPAHLAHAVDHDSTTRHSTCATARRRYTCCHLFILPATIKIDFILDFFLDI